MLQHRRLPGHGHPSASRPPTSGGAPPPPPPPHNDQPTGATPEPATPSGDAPSPDQTFWGQERERAAQPTAYKAALYDAHSAGTGAANALGRISTVLLLGTAGTVTPRPASCHACRRGVFTAAGQTEESATKRGKALLRGGGIKDTESYRDLQQSYPAYNFVSELEIRTGTVRVLSRPYNQGTY